MSQVTRCDAPSCDAELVPPSDGAWPWFLATLQVTTPDDFQQADEGGWWAQAHGQRVDACSLEHLRIAMAVKIADLTDEPAASS